MANRNMRAARWARVTASALTLAGAFAIHIQILLAGQIRPMGPKAEGLPDILPYYPSVWEILVVVGAASVMLLLYTWGESKLNLDDAPSSTS